MQGKLLQHELRTAWKGFAVISLLIIITLVSGVPVSMNSDFGVVTSTSRSDFVQITLLAFIGLLAFGSYQLFRELFVPQAGLLFTVPADIHSLLGAKLRGATVLTFGALFLLFGVGLLLGFIHGIILPVVALYLALCAYRAMLALGYRRIALSHKAGKDITSALAASLSTMLKGFTVLGAYFALCFFLLAFIVVGTMGSAMLLVPLIIVGIGLPLLVVTRRYMTQAARILGGA